MTSITYVNVSEGNHLPGTGKVVSREVVSRKVVSQEYRESFPGNQGSRFPYLSGFCLPIYDFLKSDFWAKTDQTAPSAQTAKMCITAQAAKAALSAQMAQTTQTAERPKLPKIKI